MHTTPAADTGDVLDRAEANVVALRQAEFQRLRIARDWVLSNPPAPGQAARNPLCARSLGASNVVVLPHVEAELAAALEVTPLTALRLMADAVDVDRRLPRTWAACAEGRLPVWVARRIAALTYALTAEQAGWVEAQVADLLSTLPPGRLLAVVEARVKEADQEMADRAAALAAQARGVWRGRVEPGSESGTIIARGDAAGMERFYETVDHVAHLLRDHCLELADETMDQLRARAFILLGNPMAALKLMVGADEHDLPAVVAEAIRRVPAKKYRPRTTLFVHLTHATLAGLGVARAEEVGALTRQQLIDLLCHEHIDLKPVIDLNTEIAADCYEVPANVREQLQLARPADCFPYAQSLSDKQDQDHTDPYDWTGPPGQTRLSNLGRLVRRHHRVKTFAGWKVWQHEGRFTWISPHGRIYITDGRGTHKVEIYRCSGSVQQLTAEHVLAS